MNQVILLSGPPGAGKTLVGEALCERFDRMVHVEVDELRHWVKAGYRHPWVGDRQAAEQLELAGRSAVAVAREAINMRYSVVITDVALPQKAELYRDLLYRLPVPAHIVTLLPSLEVTLARDAESRVSFPERIEPLHRLFTDAVAEGTLPGVVLDTSTDSGPQQTADRVQDLVGRGLSLVRASNWN
ncbi:MAG: AAA family ATPase [Dehalococcoidia bacterium]